MISDSFIFTGQKITLRKITLSDVNRSYIGWLNDADVTKYLSPKEIEAWIHIDEKGEVTAFSGINATGPSLKQLTLTFTVR